MGIWGVLKYANFFIDNINTIGHLFTGTDLLHPVSLILPLGISFYTFHAIGYLVDVYRGNARVQKNVFSYGAYVTMFPQLIAGPIVRYADIEQQLLKSGSKQEDLYGFNIVYDDREIEYDSLINIPRNRDFGYPRGGTTIKDIRIQEKIREVIEKWIVL